MSKLYRFRILVVFTPFILILALTFFRLYQIQIALHSFYQKKAERKYYRKIEIKPNRGIIYDARLNPLTLNKKVYSLWADPQEIKDKQKTARKLAQVLKKSSRSIYRRLNRPRRRFVWIKRKLTPLEEKKVRKLNLKGCWLIKEDKRCYPHSSLACHILGFVDIDNRGLAGIEQTFDSYLRGIPGWMKVQKDVKNRKIIPAQREKKNPTGGYHLKLTLDLFIQHLVEEELEQACQKFKAQSGFVIITEAATGKILALANYPFFDPNCPQKFPVEARRNRAIVDIFEPGSTMKIFLASAALEEGVVSLEEEIFCENGVYAIGRHKLHDHEKYGFLSFTEVIAHSSNIGIVKVGMRVGKKKIYQYFSAFGFGQKTNLPLPGEARGILRKPIFWSKYSLSAISIGQEIAVTGIQLIRAVGAIANGGYLVSPYLVSEIFSEEEIVKKFHPHRGKQILSPETVDKVNRLLKEVVLSGTGTRAALKFFQVAGKTGTAQKIDPKTKSYSQEKYVSSFVGYLPADDPRVVILVVINEPQKLHYGGEVAAPLFKKIAERTLKHLKIFPLVRTGEKN